MVIKALGVLAVMLTMSISSQQGCTDVKRAMTHWTYYPIRDMRQTVVIDPQRGDPLNGFKPAFRAPDSLAIPRTGKDRYYGEAPYEGMPFQKVATGMPADSGSLALGDSLYHTVCVACHGKAMAGDGLVAAQFMPPPDLLAEATRNRTDGFIYMYMRHGGVVMPSYGNALTERDAWSLVHYIRQQQRVSPR